MEGKQDGPVVKPRRYDVEELKYLKDSPYVVKPSGLPPADQWMGPPADTTRNSTKSGADRAKNHDPNVLLDQTPRRPGTERHISRNSANPEDIILGPPKTSFLSATPFRNPGKTFDSPDRPPLRDADSRDRFNLRTKTEGEGDRTREGRNNLRPKRVEGDQDSDGWSTVKPRKSFGTEGAERFNGRMGLDRHRDDRRFKDREDRDLKERPRGFDTFSRDGKDGDHDQDRDSRKNGTGRGRNEPSWFRDKDNTDAPPTPRERNSNGDRFADRSRGWRDKDRDDKPERNDRGDRRWERDNQRQEREPEWMDEPVDEKNDRNKAHSLEEFQKWKEQMSGKDKAGKAAVEEAPSKSDAPSFFGLEKKVLTPMEMDSGPDKFFGKWSTPKDEIPPELGPEMKKENVVKAKTTGKSSRFTSFFNQEDAQRRQSEPPANPPPVQCGPEASQPAQQDEKQAFAALLQKLHLGAQGGSGSTPSANPALQTKPPVVEKAQNNGPGPEMFQQYRPERQEEVRPAPRTSQTLQDLQNQRQLAGSQPSGRPNSTEQLLQDLVGQRQTTVSQSSLRPGQPQRRDTQTDFLMGLMKSAPEPQRSEQVLLGIPPKQSDRQLQQQMMDREQEMQRAAAAQRERSASQRQARPQPPPGFYDDPAFQRGPLPHERQPQPTQILTRPPPPGLDLGWDRQAQIPPQHRAQNIAPPPGLASGPGRMPMPQQMFPPFPMGAFPPPDVMSGPPRNMQMQPPPGFYNPPPPGFMPPGMSGFQGPESMAFGAPFDGRGPPPQGAFRRQ